MSYYQNGKPVRPGHQSQPRRGLGQRSLVLKICGIDLHPSALRYSSCPHRRKWRVSSNMTRTRCSNSKRPMGQFNRWWVRGASSVLGFCLSTGAIQQRAVKSPARKRRSGVSCRRKLGASLEAGTDPFIGVIVYYRLRKYQGLTALGRCGIDRNKIQGVNFSIKNSRHGSAAEACMGVARVCRSCHLPAASLTDHDTA